MNNEFITIADFRGLPQGEQLTPQALGKVSTEDLNQLLHYYVLTDEGKEAIANELKKRDPNFVYKIKTSLDPKMYAEDKSYPALNIIATIYKVLGWVIIVGGLFGAVGYIEKSILISIIIIVAAIFASILSFAAAESIKVITDISSFSFQILKHLKSKD